MGPERWLHELDLRRAHDVVPVPGGAAVLHPSYSSAHDHNKLSLLTPAPAAQVAAAADEVLGHLPHRLVELRFPGTVDLEPFGYARSDNLLMTYDGHARPAEPVDVLTLEQRVAAATLGWRSDLPTAGPEVWRQLGERISTALPATFLGVLDAGVVVARADLLVHGGTAQVEEVVTLPSHRGRGLASRLVLSAAARALAEGCSQVFLVADADDWPRHLYERLGFTPGSLLPTYSR